RTTASAESCTAEKPWKGKEHDGAISRPPRLRGGARTSFSGAGARRGAGRGRRQEGRVGRGREALQGGNEGARRRTMEGRRDRLRRSPAAARDAFRRRDVLARIFAQQTGAEGGRPRARACVRVAVSGQLV